MENTIFEFLTSGRWDGGALVTSLRASRETNFGEVPYTMPSFEDILAPNGNTVTGMGAQNWSNDWEKPRRKFKVLGEWGEFAPTDGVYMEPSLGECNGVDGLRVAELQGEINRSYFVYPAAPSGPTPTVPDSDGG